MFYFVLIYFINFVYDITYIGLHVYSLDHNVMYLLVYSLQAHLYISSSIFMYFVSVFCVTNLALCLQQTNKTYLLTYNLFCCKQCSSHHNQTHIKCIILTLVVYVLAEFVKLCNKSHN